MKPSILRHIFLFATLQGSVSGMLADNTVPSPPVSPVLEGEHCRTRPRHSFFAPVYTLPSQIKYASEYDYVRIGSGFEKRQEAQPWIVQLGNGYRRGLVEVENFTTLKNNGIAWGTAHYKNGVVQNPVWNETSDFRLLYPYIVGDSIGGNLFSEEYGFAGGYRQDAGRRLSLSAMLSYRGLLEYRNKDPRPKNTTSDIGASVGAAYTLAEQWSIGLDLRARRYKQTARIDFFSELGASPVYHFVGLGREYARFSGDKTAYYYEGNGAGASLSFYDTHTKGLSLVAGYDYLDVQKRLLSLNKLPMTGLEQHSLTLDARYRYSLGKQLHVGIGAKGLLHNSIGTENLFGDPAQGEYRVIASTKQYRASRSALTISTFGEYRLSPAIDVYTLPSFVLERTSEQYIFPKRLQGKSVRMATLPVGTTYKSDKWLLRLSISAFYAQAVAPHFVFEEAENDARFIAFVEQNHRYFYSSVEGISASLAAYCAIDKRFSLFVDAGWETHRSKAAPNTMQLFSVKCGVML